MYACAALFLYLVQSVIEPVGNLIACVLIGYDVGAYHIVFSVFALSTPWKIAAEALNLQKQMGKGLRTAVIVFCHTKQKIMII